MKKAKCVNGHFFDIERFPDCPICGAGVTGAEFTPETKNAAGTDFHTTPLWASAGVDDSFINSVTPSSASPKPSSEKRKSLSVSREALPESVDELAPTELLQPNDLQTLENLNKAGAAHVDTSITTPTKEPELVTSLSAAVEATASKSTTALPKTMAYYDFDEVKPPVGWLVCIKGVYVGRAFECKTGRNRIGRNRDMDICLLDDTSISRETHALIIYEPKQRVFYLQVGTSDGLTYHNGNYVFDHSELHAYDKIELGKAEFLFLPLCGEQFTWDDYTKRD